MICLFMEKL